MIKAMIADDHKMFREVLSVLFSQLPDMKIACEATNGNEIITQLKQHDVDIVLLDITLPGNEFLTTMHRIDTEVPCTKVLVLTVHSEEVYALRALKAGARGFLTKQCSAENLADAIRQIHTEGTHITKTLAKLLLENQDNGDLRPVRQRLTVSENKTLHLLVNGEQVSDIANQLSLSPETVHAHKAGILRKIR